MFGCCNQVIFFIRYHYTYFASHRGITILQYSISLPSSLISLSEMAKPNSCHPLDVCRVVTSMYYVIDSECAIENSFTISEIALKFVF